MRKKLLPDTASATEMQSRIANTETSRLFPESMQMRIASTDPNSSTNSANRNPSSQQPVVKSSLLLQRRHKSLFGIAYLQKTLRCHNIFE